MTATNEKIKWIAKTTLLNRGWTEATIRKLLPEPNEKKNPHFACASPMLLWNKAVVVEAEQSEVFLSAKAKKVNRSKAMVKVHDKKRQELLDWVDNLMIEVPLIDLSVLRKRTLHNKNNQYECQSAMRGTWYETDAFRADESTKQRWEVNYLRHNMTNYEEMLDNIFGKTGVREAYVLLKVKILKKIAEVYPHLAAECKNQIGNLEIVNEIGGNE